MGSTCEARLPSLHTASARADWTLIQQEQTQSGVRVKNMHMLVSCCNVYEKCVGAFNYIDLICQFHLISPKGIYSSCSAASPQITSNLPQMLEFVHS